MNAPTNIAKKEESELYKTLHVCRRAFTYALVFSLIINIFMLLLPIYSLQVLDRVMSSRSYETLIMLTIIAVIAFIFYGVFNALRAFILNSVVEWLDIKLAPRLLKISVVKSSLGAHANAGQQQRDLANIKNFIQSGLPVILDAPWSILFVLVIYMINPILGFLSVIGAILLLIMAYINEVATKKPLEAAQGNTIQSMQMADMSAKNAEAIESMGMMPNIIRSWIEHSSIGLQAQYLSAERSQIVQSISKSLRLTLQIGVIGIGGYLALQNELTVGGMIAASILVGRALAPFEGAINVWKTLTNARDSYHRLEQSLENTPDLRGTMALPAPSGNITVENLIYRPGGTGDPIIKGISFAVNAGEALGIIGPSAAGKSTLSKLLIGILPPSHGSVRLDGADIFKWNREDLGQYVGYMPQHVDLFAGTIRDNIARMDRNAPNDKVFRAAQLAGVHELILRLPKGYETVFDQNNLSLSPGQRQRIGLARALYCEPKLLVLDEPNSNLDGEGERALIVALQRIKKMGVTIIVVAHRPSIVSNVDKILMLRSGVIENFGPRDQVLAQYTTPSPGAAAAQSTQAPQQQTAAKGDAS